jgi:hypothetical protein
MRMLAFSYYLSAVGRKGCGPLYFCLLYKVLKSRKYNGVYILITYSIVRAEVPMNEQEFQAKLAELMGDINTLDPAQLEHLKKLTNESKARQESLKKTVATLQESLDYLRLSIKYLVFDLEATRRENGYLRKMLEEQGGD